MAYRFANGIWVKQGTLDNTIEGKVVGDIELAFLGSVKLELQGNMLRELRGEKIRFENRAYDPSFARRHGSPTRTFTPAQYFEGFSRYQKGEVGNIYIDHRLHVHWFSDVEGECEFDLPKEACIVY